MGLLEGDRTDLARPFDVDGAMLADKARKCSDGGKPLIAGGDRTSACHFDISQKGPDLISRQVDDMQTINGFANVFRDERDQLAQTVAVTLLGIASKVSFGDDMFE
jgi:hypothetical protein